jgi:RNA polymerase sigma-70 factor (ECF subfamily)
MERIRGREAMASVRSSEAVKIPMKTDELFRKHAGFVARFMSRLGVAPDELDDAVQEVFLVVHRHGGYSPGPATPTSYLASIAIRAAANHRRRVRKSRERATDLAPDETTSPSQDPARSLETHESLEHLQEALDVLDPTLKATLVLAELEGENCKTIASTLRIPMGTVYWRLHRARKEFRVALESRALARERPAGRSGHVSLGSILFARSVAGRTLEAARARPFQFDVAGALSRFQELVRAGAAVPSWAPGALVAAGAGTSLGLASPAIISAVVAVHVVGGGISHLGPDRGAPDALHALLGDRLGATIALASTARPQAVTAAAFTPAVDPVTLPAPLATPPAESLIEAPVEPRTLALAERPRLPAEHGEHRVEVARAANTTPGAPRPSGDETSAANEVHEIEDVASAERLLATSPAQALALVQSDDARFAGGYLREERRYIGVLALLKVGRIDDGQRQGASFLADYPDGPYAQRVRGALAATH